MGVAQLVEHWSPKPGVASSSLAAHATGFGISFRKRNPNKENFSNKNKTGMNPDFIF